MPAELIKPDADFRLIETFGYRPGQKIAHAQLHIARLERSARRFGIPLNSADVQNRLDLISGADPLRCRLTLAANGALDLQFQPLPSPVGSWRFCLANERLRSDDLFLQHKTSRRALYETSRNALPPGVDEWIFLNERGEVCEGTISNIAIKTPEGLWLTPPISSGCLPGVFRQSLLNAGELHEAVLTSADLADAGEISLMNALRGEIKALWVPY